MYCKNCGKTLAADDKFCSGCGEKVQARRAVTISEPMFFLEKTESEEVKSTERKQKRVIHLDEFQWDLDGYPTETKKTADVDFDWGSVLEDRAKREEPRGFGGEKVTTQVEEKKPEPEMPKTVEELLAALPEDIVMTMTEEEPPVPAAEAQEITVPAETEASDETQDAVEAADAEAALQKEEEMSDEPAVVESEETKEDDFDFVKKPGVIQEPIEKPSLEEIKSIEDLIAEMGTSTVEEPTRLISKSQIKAESVDRFYIFSKKQAEYQAMLDQEYDKIQNSLAEKQEHISKEEKEEKEESAAVEPLAQEVKTEAVEEAAVEETTASTPKAEPVPERPLEVVAVIWAKPPAGIIAGPEQEMAPVEIAPVDVMPAKVTPEEKAVEDEVKEPLPKPAAQHAEEEKTEESEALTEGEEGKAESLTRDTIVVTKETITAAMDAEKETEAETEDKAEAKESESEAETDEEEKPVITFADIFSEDDEEEEEKGGGFLKVVAVILIILIILELGVLIIPKVAPDSQVAKVINQAYGKVISLFTGDENTPPVQETEGPSEMQSIIETQKSKNENIIAILEDSLLVFEEGKDYGFEDFGGSYAFQNSTWYKAEDGTEVSYGDEIVGTVIQFYSAFPDKVNDINHDVIDFVDKTSPYYDEIDALAEDSKREYVVNQLAFGEIRTGEEGFYVLVNVTTTEKSQPDGVMEKQIVYLKPNLTKKEMKIMEIKKI